MAQNKKADELAQSDKVSPVEALIVGGQIYVPEGLTEDRRAVRWWTRCANCGEKCSSVTPLAETVGGHFGLSRRFTSCKKPGKKVARLRRWVTLRDYRD